jgi:catechol 2,3-dioxygenase-like lactoylglutathione lyase family enzyme
MAIKGINHLTFIVRDLERTVSLLCQGLGAHEVYDRRHKNYSLSREKFFVLGDIWLVIMEGEAVQRSYRHVAFTVDEDELAVLEIRLRELDVEIRPSRSRVTGEGRSLYFYDYDNNLFELHTGTLGECLKRYAI